jgi:hypothetical protein
MPQLKKFFPLVLKSLNHHYYRELSERRVESALIYFFALLLFGFVLAGILSLPLLFFLKADVDEGLLAINTFKINADFETVRPISLPSQQPLITLDTTNQKTIDTEVLLITNDKMYYQLLNKKGEVALKEFDFTSNRKQSTGSFMWLLIFLIPSIFSFYYLAYLLKYIIIIFITILVGFVLAKMMKNIIEFRETVVLAIYTSTAMVLLEVLSLPFFIKKYLLTYTPFVGLNISLVAITIYLILFAIAVRTIGNASLRQNL